MISQQEFDTISALNARAVVHPLAFLSIPQVTRNSEESVAYKRELYKVNRLQDRRSPSEHFITIALLKVPDSAVHLNAIQFRLNKELRAEDQIHKVGQGLLAIVFNKTNRKGVQEALFRAQCSFFIKSVDQYDRRFCGNTPTEELIASTVYKAS